MGHEPAADHLELWRGIDDAVWREARRGARVAAAWAPSHLAAPRREERRIPERAAEPALPLVPEPA